METLSRIIEYIGPSNVLAIILFLISVFIASYLYYRTFFRLVYSTGRICKTCKNIKDWQSDDTEFVSRIAIYNNGRKTLTTKEVHLLEIEASIKTNQDIKVIVGKEQLKITVAKDKLKLDFDYLDSRKFFVLEIKHNGMLQVNGRVSESGKILQTEHVGWVVFNLAFVFISLLLMGYNMQAHLVEDKADFIPFFINMLLLFGIYKVIRLIHALLYIPDSLSSKYLDTTDKWNKKFKIDF